MTRRRIVAVAVALSLAPWFASRAFAQTMPADAASPAVVADDTMLNTSTLASAVAAAAAQSTPTPSTFSNSVFEHASGSSSAALKSLYATTALMQALDVRSTLTAFSHGAVEANPLMGGITSHTPVFIATKAAIATSMILGAHQMAAHHRFAAIATLIGINSAYAMVVSHNYHVAASR